MRQGSASSVGDASVGMEMLLPIGISQVGITDRASTVEHHVVADIDTAVGDAFYAFTHSAIEEDNVTGPDLVTADIPAQAEDALGPQASGVADAAGGEDIAYKPGTVETGLRIGTAPYIRITDILGGFIHEFREGWIGIQ